MKNRTGVNTKRKESEKEGSEKNLFCETNPVDSDGKTWL